ncbi:LysR family transcriptional regulator [Terasakiispira papahanaumokuakeensis]|uniref:LysR family transcriptional regulator n=1 Tax=Terasakiispira papahanaumokuakeensis TaxID=197479 RepID=A0A1E2V8C5_9GAMM|nr:LysR family transcriptional regulator [Terasakiispira papahanaumokuakeensis]ODC02905.1 LysR family transcriptional regulator [Terasakiispira papahanaumokuakeensis]
MTKTSRIPPLKALYAFDVTANTLSMSDAATQLNVTHGAVSRQIRLLEDTLGVTLFQRQSRGLVLTEAGMQLKATTRESFTRLRETCQQISDSPSQRPWVLSCPGSLLARWFIPRLDQLRQDLPSLNLHLTASESTLDPRQSGIDATLQFADPPWPDDMQVWPLMPERIGPVMSPTCQRFGDHPAADALLDEPLLHTRSRQSAWPQWAQQMGLDATQLHYGEGFEHLNYLLEAALVGLGVAIAPEYLVSAELERGRLIAPWGFVETGAWLSLWQPGSHPAPHNEQLAQWLKSQLIT